MKEWLSVNWKPIAGVLLITALYVISKWFPEASLEHAYVENIAQMLGIALIPLVPGLRKTKRKGDQ